MEWWTSYLCKYDYLLFKQSINIFKLQFLVAFPLRFCWRHFRISWISCERNALNRYNSKDNLMHSEIVIVYLCFACERIRYYSFTDSTATVFCKNLVNQRCHMYGVDRPFQKVRLKIVNNYFDCPCGWQSLIHFWVAVKFGIWIL